MKFAGQLIRPATHEYAVRNYPGLVVNMALGQASNSFSLSGSMNGRQILTYNDLLNGIQYVILQEDFDLCKKAAYMLGTLPLFASDTRAVYVERARGFINELFRNRAP